MYKRQKVNKQVTRISEVQESITLKISDTEETMSNKLFDIEEAVDKKYLQKKSQLLILQIIFKLKPNS